MAFPSALFIDSPEVEDASLHQLSTDVENWPEEVVQKFKERIPKAAGMSVITKFMKKDEENGTATGSVVVSNEKKQCIIPLIVKDFMLYPLDVMIVDRKMIPLTPEYFDLAFQENDVFGKLEEYPVFGGLGRFEDANLWNATYPPSLGRYAYAAGPYEILDNISDSIDPTEMKKYLSDNPGVAVNLKKHGHAELIKKLANLQPVNMNEFRQGVDNLVQRPISMLRKEGPNKYTILSNSDSFYSPSLTTVDRKGAHKFCSKVCDCAADDMNDVDMNGEKVLYVPGRDKDVQFDPEDQEMIEDANEYDHYVVKNRNGGSVEGVVIPLVIDFSMEKVPLKIFIGKTMSTIQPEISGVRLKNSRFQLEEQPIKVGETGTFVYQDNKSKALATIPVTIKSILEEFGNTIVEVMDLMGKGHKLKIEGCGNHDLKRIVPHPRFYMMPEGFKWIPMSGFQRVSNSAHDYTAMEKAHIKTGSPTKLMSTGYGQYAMKGVEKYASVLNWDSTNLEGYQAKFLLASLGASMEKIAQAIEHANKYGQTMVHGLNYVPTQEEKVAEAMPRARQMVDIANSLRSNLIKEASYLDNTQTVDALLSLNFVTPENVAKFVQKTPHFKSCISHLASTLIASRLGMQEVPEQAVSSAMHRLIEVVDGLEALRAKQEIQQ